MSMKGMNSRATWKYTKHINLIDNYVHALLAQNHWVSGPYIHQSFNGKKVVLTISVSQTYKTRNNINLHLLPSLLMTIWKKKNQSSEEPWNNDSTQFQTKTFLSNSSTNTQEANTWVKDQTLLDQRVSLSQQSQQLSTGGFGLKTTQVRIHIRILCKHCCNFRAHH